MNTKVIEQIIKGAPKVVRIKILLEEVKMNKFTKGEWQVINPNTGFVYCLNGNGCNQFQLQVQGNGRNGAAPAELAANASLIATAGTTATKLAEMGFDAVRVIERLPEIVQCDNERQLWDLLEKCRGE